MAEWSSVPAVTAAAATNTSSLITPWPSWIPMPTAQAETVTVSIPTTITGSGFTTTYTTEATMSSVGTASLDTFANTKTDQQIEQASASPSSSSGDISELAGLLGFGDDGSRRTSVALVCLAFALGVAGVILLFLLARWYRIRQQKKRADANQQSSDSQQNQPTQSDQYPDNDVERQYPDAGPSQGGGMARSHSAQSNVPRNANGQIQESGRISPMSPEVSRLYLCLLCIA